jgi:hypothetical protein
MDANQKKLAAKVLELASDTFSNHGCNDFNLTNLIPNPTERNELVRAYHEYNGDLDDYDEYNVDATDLSPDYRLMDWMIMGWLADILKAEAGA